MREQNKKLVRKIKWHRKPEEGGINRKKEMDGSLVVWRIKKMENAVDANDTGCLSLKNLGRCC
jgi:hypothetical protein